MNEDDWRSLVAANAAHATLIEYLFRTIFNHMDDDSISGLIDVLKKTATDPAQFTDVAKGNDQRAELLADVVVQMQGHISGILNSAAAAVRAGRKQAQQGQ